MMAACEFPLNRPCDLAMAKLKSHRCEPVMACSWNRALFTHFEVEPSVLQQHVPLALDTFHGRAYITVVAMQVANLRTPRCARLGQLMLRPLAIGPLMNVRTYVRHHGEAGIFLLTQWMGSRLNLFFGPRTYGLPYRLGQLNYNHDSDMLNGIVTDRGSRASLIYGASLDAKEHVPTRGSLEEFLLEHYTAYTQRNGRLRYYRIWHPPWPYREASVRFTNTDLLTQHWPFLRGAEPLCAQFSPGLDEVLLGRPHRLPSTNPIRSAFLKFP